MLKSGAAVAPAAQLLPPAPWGSWDTFIFDCYV